MGIAEKVATVAGLLGMTSRIASQNSGHEVYTLTCDKDSDLRVSISVGVHTERCEVSPIFPRDHQNNWIDIYGVERQETVAKAQRIGMSFKKGAAVIASDIEKRLLPALLDAIEIYKTVRIENAEHDKNMRELTRNLMVLTGAREERAKEFAYDKTRTSFEWRRYAEPTQFRGFAYGVCVNTPTNVSIKLDSMTPEQATKLINLLNTFE